MTTHTGGKLYLAPNSWGQSWPAWEIRLDGEVVGSFYDVHLAERLVTQGNSHPDLVAAAQEALEELRQWHEAFPADPDSGGWLVTPRLEAALAAAKTP